MSKSAERKGNVAQFPPSQWHADAAVCLTPEGTVLPAAAHQRETAAVVTVTRYIGGDRLHAHVPVFVDELAGEAADLSELLADRAFEANLYLDRVAATRAARPLHEFTAQSA